MFKINWTSYLDYDERMQPPAIRPIIFVKGSHYEMGYQYGKEVADMIKRNFCLIARAALTNYSKEEAEDRVRMLLQDMDKTPEIKEWFRGIADGAGMGFWDIALINVQLWMSIPYMMCSTVGLSGSVTADGKLIVGVNGDITYDMSGYGVVLVAYPDNQDHAFVTIPQLAGQMGANYALNDQGVLITFDGGEAEGENDVTFGYADFISSMVYSMMKADSAKEAAEVFKSLHVAGGWIFLFADRSGDMFIVEHTSAKDVTRYPGDHGEKGFINAANHFIDPELAKVSGMHVGNEESKPRHDTERIQVEENLGNLTVEMLMDILACPDYWDGKKWHRDVWDPYYSGFSPAMRQVDFRSGTRCIGIPEDITSYILQGTKNRAVSFIPNSMGKYSMIKLLPTMQETVEAIEENAILAAWEAAARMSVCEKPTAEQYKLIDEARTHIWIGKNYMNKAIVVNKLNKGMDREYFSKAASEFDCAYVKSQLV